MNDASDRQTESSRQRLLLLLLVVLGYGRVVWQLGEQDLWWDESLSLQRAESALLPLLKGHLIMYDGLSSLRTIDQHPFMFFLLQGGLIRLVGDSEFAVRYISVMAATLLVAVLWVFARWSVRRGIFPSSTPYWAAGFAAISPFFLWFGQEARPYALWGMLAPLTTYLLLRATETNRVRWGWMAGFAITELMFLTSHFYAIFLLPIHALLIFLWLARRNRRQAFIVSGVMLAMAAMIGAAIYWFFIVVQGGGANFSSARLDVLVPDLLNAFSLGLSVDIDRVWWIDLIFGAIMLLGTVWSLRSRSVVAGYGWLPIAMVGTPIGMLLLVNQVLPAYMTARHMALIGGAVLVLLGGGMGVITQVQRWVAAIIALLLVAATGYSTVNYFTMEEYAEGDMSGLGSYLEDRVAPGDLLLIKSPYSWRIADYYLPTEAVDAANAANVSILHYGVPLLNAQWWETTALLEGLKDDYRRVWLVRIGPHLYPDVEGRVEEWFAENMFLLREDDFFSHSTLRAFLYLPEVPVYHSAVDPAQQPADVVFGDQIRLSGYELGEYGSPELALPVTLHWHPLAKIDKNYKYVLQLEETQNGDSPTILSRTEREPYDGSIATSFWEPDITILEHTELPAMPTPPDAATDRLTLRIYDRETLEPLLITQDGDLEVLPDGTTVVLPLWSKPTE